MIPWGSLRDCWGGVGELVGERLERGTITNGRCRRNNLPIPPKSIIKLVLLEMKRCSPILLFDRNGTPQPEGIPRGDHLRGSPRGSARGIRTAPLHNVSVCRSRVRLYVVNCHEASDGPRRRVRRRDRHVAPSSPEARMVLGLFSGARNNQSPSPHRRVEGRDPLKGDPCLQRSSNSSTKFSAAVFGRRPRPPPPAPIHHLAYHGCDPRWFLLSWAGCPLMGAPPCKNRKARGEDGMNDRGGCF